MALEWEMNIASSFSAKCFHMLKKWGQTSLKKLEPALTLAKKREPYRK